MVQDESSSESCKALFFFRKINTPYIRGKSLGVYKPVGGPGVDEAERTEMLFSGSNS